MGRILRWLVLVPPVFFAIVLMLQGIMWLFRPERAAVSWGFEVPDGGLALSSMIGALVAWSLTISATIFIAVIRRERVWFYPAMMLFFFLGVGRVVAGLLHGAPLDPTRFIVEFAITGLLFLASRYGVQKG